MCTDAIDLSEIRVSNIVCHFKLDREIESQIQTTLQGRIKASARGTKKYANFFVQYPNSKGSIVFTIFRHHVNITGLRSFKVIPFAIQTFKDNFQLPAELNIDPIINNICASTQLVRSHTKEPCDVALMRIAQLPESRFIPDLFAGLTLQFRSKEHGVHGTVVLFKSAKMNILGCKSLNDVEKIAEMVKSLLCQHNCFLIE